MGDSGEYTLFTLGEDQVAGGYDKTGVLPDQVPPHWLVYFAVDDIEATVANVTALGAKAGDIIDLEMAGRRMSVIHDPQGAVFGVFQG
jgi:predicted enzyme related to lactoylglutathione lyase